MLGGGNPVAGSNPTGVGSSINYIRTDGKTFAYAYSGPVVVNNTTVTALKFTTGTVTVEGEVELSGNMAFMGSNKLIGLIIKFDGQKISSNQYLTNNSQNFHDVDSLNLIIPPYTNVEIDIITDNAADIDYFATLTGRAY